MNDSPDLSQIASFPGILSEEDAYSQALEHPFLQSSYRPTGAHGYGATSPRAVAQEMFQRYEQFGQEHPFIQMAGEIAASRLAPHAFRAAGFPKIAEVLDLASKQWSPEGWQGGAQITTRPKDLNIDQIMKNVPAHQKRGVREQLRRLISTANQFPEEGPQHMGTRVEAIKYALGLPSKLIEKWNFLDQSRISEGERDRLQKPIQAAFDWADKLASDAYLPLKPLGADLKVAGTGEGPKPVIRGGPETPGITIEGKSIKDWLKKVASKPDAPSPKDKNLLISFEKLGLGRGADRENVRNTVLKMLEIANQEGGGIPDKKMQRDAIRYVMGFDAPMIKQLQEGRDWLQRHGPGKEHLEQYRQIKYMVGSIEQALKWAKKLYDQAFPRPKR